MLNISQISYKTSKIFILEIVRPSSLIAYYLLILKNFKSKITILKILFFKKLVALRNSTYSVYITNY